MRNTDTHSWSCHVIFAQHSAPVTPTPSSPVPSRPPPPPPRPTQRTRSLVGDEHGHKAEEDAAAALGQGRLEVGLVVELGRLNYSLPLLLGVLGLGELPLPCGVVRLQPLLGSQRRGRRGRRTRLRCLRRLLLVRRRQPLGLGPRLLRRLLRLPRLRRLPLGRFSGGSSSRSGCDGGGSGDGGGGDGVGGGGVGALKGGNGGSDGGDGGGWGGGGE